MNVKCKQKNREHPRIPSIGAVVAAAALAVGVILSVLFGSALVGSSSACVDAQCMPNGHPVNCGAEPPELCETKTYRECISTASWRVQHHADTKSCKGIPQPCANSQTYHCYFEDCRWNLTCQTYIVNWYGYGGWCKDL